MRGRVVSCAIGVASTFLLVGACSTSRVDPQASRSTTPSADATATIAELARGDVGLTRLLAPRSDGFQVGSDGGIFTAGWERAGNATTGLSMRMSSSSVGVHQLGTHHGDRHTFRLSEPFATARLAEVVGGRVLYRDVYPDTDALFATSGSRVEEVWLLRSQVAPRSFTLKLALPPGDVSVEHRKDAGLWFFESGRALLLHVPEPIAFDAHGTRHPAQLSWNREASTIEIAIPPSAELAYPVLLDPAFETEAWVELRNPVPRFGSAAAFDEENKRLVLFGGQPQNGARLSDLWLWDGYAWAEAQLPRGSSRPPSRMNHAMVYDSDRKRVFLFGGTSPTGFPSDTWTWDGISWREEKPTNRPSARQGHGLAYDRVHKNVVLFGGTDTTNFNLLAETWTWDGSNWTLHSPPVSPPARSQTAMGFDVARGQVVLAGGFGASPLSDTWTWDGTTWSSASSGLPTIYDHSITYDPVRKQLLLFGGATSGGASNDLRVWNGSAWTLANGTTKPLARGAGVLAFDGVSETAILFSGYGAGGSGMLADQWTWNGQDFRGGNTSVRPNARGVPAMVYDREREEVVLHGGVQNVSDTWAWSAGVWRDRTGAGPAAQTSHASAYDAVRKEVVLFGGQAGQARLAETWVWNGAAWSQRFPANPPPSRLSHAMAFDEKRSNTVMFGGAGANGVPSSDTYLWNGTDWTLANPATKPSARFGAAMAYDPKREKVVLFGGVYASAMQDTWTWDGQNWTLEKPLTAPPPRSGAAAAYDARRGMVLLFGGRDRQLLLEDTWLWNGSDWRLLSKVGGQGPSGRQSAGLTYIPSARRSFLFGGFDESVGFRQDGWFLYTRGGECVTGAECAPGFCVDDVCCTVPSCGSCETCAGIDPGKCTPISNAEDADTCALKDKKSCDKVGKCTPGLGAVCKTEADCASGFCALSGGAGSSGVCCDTACDGACRSCVGSETIDGIDGKCGVAKIGSNPANRCEPGASCNAAGSCELKITRAAYCKDSKTFVDGTGVETACAPYVCSGDRCKERCSSIRDCSGGSVCSTEGRCIPPGAQPTDEGCSVHATGQPGRGQSAGAMALALACLLVRRVRSRRRTSDR